MKANRKLLVILFLLTSTAFAVETIYLPYDFITFKKDKIIVYKDKKSAVIDKKGNLQMPMIEGNLAEFFDDVYSFKKDKFWGLISKDGKVLVKADKYKYLKHIDNNIFRFSNDYYGRNGLYVNHKGKKVEYKSKPKSKKTDEKVYKNSIIQKKGYQEYALIQKDTKKVLVPYKKYDEIYEFNKYDLAMVKKDYGKYGFINLKGQEVIPVIYEQLRLLDIGLIAFRSDNLWGLMNETGKVILKAQYDDIQNTDLSKQFAKITLNGRYGFINKKLEEVEPPKYKYVVTISQVNDIAWLVLNGEKKLVNSKLKEIAKGKQYDNVSGVYYAKDFLEVKKDKLLGLINKDGKEIIPVKYKYISSPKEVNNKYFKVTTQDGKNGLYSYDSKLLFEPQFKRLDYYPRIKLFAYTKNDKEYGVINLQGKKTDLSFAKNTYFLTNSFYAVKNNKDKIGVINSDKKLIIPYEYDDIRYLSDEKFMFKKDDKWGVMNYEGKVVANVSFDDVFKNHFPNYSVIKPIIKDKRIGFISVKTGKIVIEPKYVDIIGRSYKSDDEYFIHVASNEGNGIINLSLGKIYIPALYNDFRDLSNGYLEAYKKEHWAIYDKLGNKIYEKKD